MKKPGNSQIINYDDLVREIEIKSCRIYYYTQEWTKNVRTSSNLVQIFFLHVMVSDKALRLQL